MAKILVIEDNDTLREGVEEVLLMMGHTVRSAENGRVGLHLYDEQRPDMVITDLKMDHMDGMQVLEYVLERDEQAIVMIITAFGSIETAVNAMQRGAFDFIPKPFPPSLLRTKVERALQVREQREQMERLKLENEMLRQDAGQGLDIEMVGSSQAIEQIFEMVHKVASTDSTVYIHGESGTGKELVARALHRVSHRAQGPFVKVNCSALSDALLESELFGHEKGAFTGAHKRRMGRFELADEGTIFLDEIGDISPALQLKLLRVLQEREFERVGGEETLQVDVRIVTATNKDLRAEVEAGRFREDLFYRLHIIPLQLPPLRERVDDIPLLVEHFIDKLSRRTRSQVRRVSPAALAMMRSYLWPGNVRELENVIEHAMVFAEGDSIEVCDLPALVRGHGSPSLMVKSQEQRTLPEVLEELERQLILKAYHEAEGVKTETARLLGIKPSALYYKLEKYGIEQTAQSS